MHKQGQALSVCLADEVSKPAWVTKESAEEVVVLDAQFCHVCTRAACHTR